MGYIKLEKNSLSITEKGINFIENLDKLNINLYAERTAELSQNLKKIYKGELKIDDILKMSEDEIKQIIHQKTDNLNLASTAKTNSKSSNVIGSCPKCGRDVIDSPKSKSYFCTGYKDGCKFGIWKTIADKNINKTIAKELLKNGKTKDKIDGFKSKAGKNFSAKLILKNDGTIGFEF